jgi:hypothetical protein
MAEQSPPLDSEIAAFLNVLSDTEAAIRKVWDDALHWWLQAVAHLKEAYAGAGSGAAQAARLSCVRCLRFVSGIDIASSVTLHSIRDEVASAVADLAPSIELGSRDVAAALPRRIGKPGSLGRCDIALLFIDRLKEPVLGGWAKLGELAHVMGLRATTSDKTSKPPTSVAAFESFVQRVRREVPSAAADVSNCLNAFRTEHLVRIILDDDAARDPLQRFECSTSHPAVQPPTVAECIAGCMAGVDRRKYADREDELNDMLRDRLRQCHADADSELDICKCKALHSRERVPFMVFPSAKAKQSNEKSEERETGEHKPEHRTPLIVKSDDDIHVDIGVLQLFECFNAIWRRRCIPIEAKLFAIVPIVRVDDQAGTSGTQPADGQPSEAPAQSPTATDAGQGQPPAALLEVVDGDALSNVRAKLLQQHESESPADSIRRTQQLFPATDAARLDDKADALMAELLLRSFQASDRKCSRFCSTFAGSAVATWVLGIKDRHNANLLYDHETGTFANVDFAFCINAAPGGAFSQESDVFNLPPGIAIALFGGDRMFKKCVQALQSAMLKDSAVRGARSAALTHTIPNLMIGDGIAAEEEFALRASTFVHGIYRGLAALREDFGFVARCVEAMPPAVVVALATSGGKKGSSGTVAGDALTVLQRVWSVVTMPPSEVFDSVASTAGHKGNARYASYQRMTNGIQ